MSLLLVKQEITNFLATDTAEVIALKGQWGTGKTHLWNACLQSAHEKGPLPLEVYSSVSLFGISNLAELKTAIAIAADRDWSRLNVPGTSKKIPFGKHIGSIWTGFKSKILPNNQAIEIPHVNVFKIISSYGFQFLKNAIICLDDFERSNLSGRDLMGLVSFLKEQKNCKVILILNEQQANPEYMKELNEYSEKVIDRHILFAPTAGECCELALDNDDDISSQIRENLIKLNVTNIRIIRKISVLANELLSKLDISSLSDDVIGQALHTLCLYSWCKYGPIDKVPNIHFATRSRSVLSKNVSEEEQRWLSILSEYDYGEPDNLDLQILKFLDDGFIKNSRDLSAAAEELNKKVGSRKKKGDIQLAWRVYHDSFDDNAEEVVQALHQALLSGIDVAGLYTIITATTLMKELGFSEKADQLIEAYFSYIQTNQSISDQIEIPANVTDAKIIEGVRLYNTQHILNYSLADVLDRISEQRGWSPKDETILASSSADDYYNLFKNTKGKALDAYITSCLSISGSSLNGNWEIISRNVNAALQRIGKETPLNLSRVKKHGVEVDEQT